MWKWQNKVVDGFSLAELLIVLAILAVIATFAIPKVLQSQQERKYNAMIKEAAATIAGAYEAYKMEHTPSATTDPRDLIPYINYVAMITDGTMLVDKECDAGAPGSCGAGWPCLKMANGGVLQLMGGWTFNGTGKLNSISFRFDPDGTYNNVATHADPGSAAQILLYYNGFLTSRGEALVNSTNSAFSSFGPSTTCDPPWLKW